MSRQKSQQPLGRIIVRLRRQVAGFRLCVRFQQLLLPDWRDRDRTYRFGRSSTYRSSSDRAMELRLGPVENRGRLGVAVVQGGFHLISHPLAEGVESRLDMRICVRNFHDVALIQLHDLHPRVAPRSVLHRGLLLHPESRLAEERRRGNEALDVIRIRYRETVPWNHDVIHLLASNVVHFCVHDSLKCVH